MSEVDYTALRTRQLHAELEAKQAAEQLAEPRRSEKPAPQTVMTFDQAKLLAEAHEYSDGETIGYSDKGHRIFSVDGRVAMDPFATPEGDRR